MTEGKKLAKLFFKQLSPMENFWMRFDFDFDQEKFKKYFPFYYHLIYLKYIDSRKTKKK